MIARWPEGSIKIARRQLLNLASVTDRLSSGAYREVSHLPYAMHTPNRHPPTRPTIVDNREARVQVARRLDIMLSRP